MFLGAAVSMVTWDGRPMPASVFLVSSITLCATLFCAALFHELFERFMLRRVFRFLFPAVTSLGTLLLASSTLSGMPSFVLAVMGAVLTGIGSGVIDLGYGELYRNLDPRKTGLEVPFAYVVAAALFLAISFLPSVWACVVCAALPVAAGWILFVDLRVWSPSTIPAIYPFEIRIKRFSWRIGVCACLVGLADGVVRQVFLSVNEVSLESFYHLPLLWASILGAVVVYGATLFAREDGLRSVYKSVMLVMAVFFMLLPVFTGNSEIESIIALAGYGTFNVLIWILLGEVSFTFRLSSVMVFGIGWGMVTLGVLLGSAAGQLIFLSSPFSPQALSLIALLATLAILVSYMFVFKERDLEELVKPEDETNAALSRQPRFQVRIRQIAEEYRLSPKETEITILFAKGRSSTRIQEDLFLSRGTVTTHLRHIYQKLGVHDRQELLDLIEGRKPAGQSLEPKQ
ncbi:MAG: LuxR C-terminal-related transcriptional regulator [Coriobacteriaceae bacterium]|nr:LuxR C-terminal-related transcriptional regulator [Coriobacteriaceae bacterium]